ncbi:MAG: protein-glutamate O-methyltransferase [Luteibacter sp.]|uniref:CheR family methyltransferase n=1 Tax=Rhodanobacteraceae TaxID=1775411 RepID=UPI0005637A26|nr:MULTISPECIES: protein-glutamate O-methyltransferase [Rhodanobacteraceae]MDQ7995169.1 protein-glutamate O-methyltransferase [Luteibacter sp.]MDR6644167.1 chemotaxis protein methyltransferase CheR [Luteibacter sp. 1214]SDG74350.1 MCP methyltransferase, CheR-type [Dyella sp. 333MFSha]SKB44497.1 MCP methyltransferase, CheR-type [Luteibacter sp. 22Crub2.1]
MNALVNNGDSVVPASAAGPSLGDADFAFLRDFVLQHCGISLGEHKRQLVQGRLLRRLRTLRLDGFSAYCDLLRRDPDGELGELASCISTNVTSFFREMHHYDLLVDELLPRWLEEKRNGGRLRIWSAGCSTGEEPYAIAMVLAEAMERMGVNIDAKILATDLSPQALEFGRKGVYPVDRLTGVSEARRKRWFLRGEGSFDGFAQVHPRLRELVTIQPLNLLHDWPMQGKFDAIFCRNVVIYFDKPTKQRLFSRYAGMLESRGYLFLGHSESMYGLSEDFDLIGRTVYRKRT